MSFSGGGGGGPRRWRPPPPPLLGGGARGAAPAGEPPPPPGGGADGSSRRHGGGYKRGHGERRGGTPVGRRHSAGRERGVTSGLKHRRGGRVVDDELSAVASIVYSPSSALCAEFQHKYAHPQCSSPVSNGAMYSESRYACRAMTRSLRRAEDTCIRRWRSTTVCVRLVLSQLVV